MISQLKSLILPPLEPAAIKAWYLARPMVRALFGGRSRYCCICNSRVRLFLAHGPGSRQRKDIMCPVCLAHSRHRLVWYYLATHTTLLKNGLTKLLHFAPEAALTNKFKDQPGLEYLSADLDSSHAMVKMDITQLACPDDCFDIIYCSHVLEHVFEDRRAMKELFRVLRPGGRALIQVPFSLRGTLEDRSVTDPAERERLYWQRDHVRLYGPDIEHRLAEAGFEVEKLFGADLLSPDRCEELGIDNSEPLFVCTKP